MVGVVPVTTSLTLGGSMELRLDMQQGNYIVAYSYPYELKQAAQANDRQKFNEILAQADHDEATATDYLTQLRLFLYIRTFAGVGFDYSVVAFKIGVFGQLDLDFQFEWLNCDYLDSWKYSMAGPLSTSMYQEMFGADLNFSGSTGIKFLFKFLFVSYEKIFCSVGFQFGGPVGEWETIEDIWADNKTISGKPVARVAMSNGQVMYAVDVGAQMEQRDYVDAAEQEWLGGQPSIELFSLDEDQGVTDMLQSGAYSYPTPYCPTTAR
ncbi:hypothetical protein I4100191B2_26610 [Clostridiales bacterium]